MICSKALAGTSIRSHSGFTLIELMLVVLLVALLGSLAIPAYQGYVEDAKRTALMRQMATLYIFQEDTRLHSGAYASGAYDITDPAEPVTTLTEATGWQPSGDDETTYSVTAHEGSYEVTAKTQDGLTLTRTFP